MLVFEPNTPVIELSLRQKLYNAGHINVDDVHISFLNEEHNPYSPNIILVMKSRRMRWAGHVARMGNRRGSYRVLVATSGGIDRLEDPSVNGSIILKWVFKGDVSLD